MLNSKKKPVSKLDLCVIMLKKLSSL